MSSTAGMTLMVGLATTGAYDPIGNRLAKFDASLTLISIDDKAASQISLMGHWHRSRC